VPVKDKSFVFDGSNREREGIEGVVVKIDDIYIQIPEENSCVEKQIVDELRSEGVA